MSSVAADALSIAHVEQEKFSLYEARVAYEQWRVRSRNEKVADAHGEIGTWSHISRKRLYRRFIETPVVDRIQFRYSPFARIGFPIRRFRAPALLNARGEKSQPYGSPVRRDLAQPQAFAR